MIELSKPIFAQCAPSSGILTARSWVKIDWGLDSSGGSSRTSRPKLRTADTRANNR